MIGLNYKLLTFVLGEETNVSLWLYALLFAQGCCQLDQLLDIRMHVEHSLPHGCQRFRVVLLFVREPLAHLNLDIH